MISNKKKKVLCCRNRLGGKIEEKKKMVERGLGGGVHFISTQILMETTPMIHKFSFVLSIHLTFSCFILKYFNKNIIESFQLLNETRALTKHVSFTSSRVRFRSQVLVSQTHELRFRFYFISFSRICFFICLSFFFFFNG